ncbi:MAG: DUF4440 domain-containing protein [Planctomycetota bacterium]|nr:DUF4440 domain-containing protein [Planctomycetota bacterium]
MQVFIALLAVTLQSAETRVNVDNLTVAREIISTVINAQTAGFERGDFEAYMSMWTADAKIVCGRGPKPGKFESVTAGTDIAKTRRMRISSIPKDLLKVTYENVSVNVDGDSATLDTVAQVDVGKDGDQEVVHEVYRLKKIDGKWRVLENRYWPVSRKSGGKTTTYDDKTWQRIDAAIADLAGTQPSELAAALMNAYRFPEAFVVARQDTKKNPRDAGAWVNRGWIAISAGKGDDALKSFETALSLDPDSQVPPSVAKAKKSTD